MAAAAEVGSISRRLGGDDKDIVVGWHCDLCISKLGDHILDIPRHPKVTLYQRQSDFFDHFDRTCHICNTEFTCKTTCQDHKRRIHTGTQAAHYASKCSLCGKEFKHKEAFKEHKKIHTPFRCAAGKRCTTYGKRDGANAFAQLDGYKKHVETCLSYQDQFYSSATATEVCCFACQKRLNSVPQLYQHLRSCEMAIRADLGRVGNPALTREVIKSHIQSHHQESEVVRVPLATVPTKEVVINKKVDRRAESSNTPKDNRKRQSADRMSLATMPPKKRHLAEAPNNSGDESDDYEEAELKVEIEEGERTPMLPPELFTRIRSAPQCWLDQDNQFKSVLMKRVVVMLGDVGFPSLDQMREGSKIDIVKAKLPRPVKVDGYELDHVSTAILDRTLFDAKNDLMQHKTDQNARMAQISVEEFPDDPDFHGFDEERRPRTIPTPDINRVEPNGVTIRSGDPTDDHDILSPEGSEDEQSESLDNSIQVIELEEDDSDGEEVQEESHTEPKDGVGDDDDDDLQVVYDDGHLENIEEFNRILNMDGASDEWQVPNRCLNLDGAADQDEGDDEYDPGCLIETKETLAEDSTITQPRSSQEGAHARSEPKDPTIQEVLNHCLNLDGATDEDEGDDEYIPGRHIKTEETSVEDATITQPLSSQEDPHAGSDRNDTAIQEVGE